MKNGSSGFNKSLPWLILGEISTCCCLIWPLFWHWNYTQNLPWFLYGNILKYYSVALVEGFFSFLLFLLCSSVICLTLAPSFSHHPFWTIPLSILKKSSPHTMILQHPGEGVKKDVQCSFSLIKFHFTFIWPEHILPQLCPLHGKWKTGCCLVFFLDYLPFF